MQQDFVIIAARGKRHLVRITDIQEILSMLLLIEVDGQSGAFRGVANLRGTLLPVFDLSGEAAALAPSRFILICRTGEQTYGLIVDEVDDVVRIPTEQLSLQSIGGGKTILMTRIQDEVLSVLEPGDALARLC